MRALVLGGYGHFGTIISKRLAEAGGFEVIVAGRNAVRARRLASALGASPACFDIAGPDLAAKFAEHAAGIVISTVGPFQGQGYRVAEAAIEAGAHYVDIADARAFVCGIRGLDARARHRGVLAVSGASSVPALSAAVVDRFAGEFEALHEIEIAISSSGKTPGEATVAAVLGYCGKPIAQWRDGAWSSRRGWRGLRRHRFRTPPMTRWISDCETPDLELFPERYPGVHTVRFGAGSASSLVQLGLWLLSWGVGWNSTVDAARLAPALARAARLLEFLDDGRSGMFVRISGTAPGGARARRTWEITAADNDGMHIPCVAAVLVAKKLARGGLPACGATPCVGLLSLEEYLDELRGMKVESHAYAH